MVTFPASDPRRREQAVVAGDELIFRNGAVFDGRRFLPEGTCVRVSDGTITVVGLAQEVAGPGGLTGVNVVDLDGGTLLPGFTDAHVHPVYAGSQMRHCNLREGQTAQDYLDIIAAYAAAHPDAQWITGGGWSMDAFPRGLPRREPLDAVTGNRPAFLPNRDGHGAWVNTAALRLAGIDATTADPADGRIERDADGEPNGALQEGAADLVSRLLPDTSDADWDAALATAQDYLLSLGITGWQDAIIGSFDGARDNLPVYLRAAEAGRLAVNVTGALWWDRERGLDQLPELLHRREMAQANRAETDSGFRAFPRHQREDDAGRGGRDPHRGDAGAVPGRGRLYHRAHRAGFHRPGRAAPVRHGAGP